jgi:hypothetical protein
MKLIAAAKQRSSVYRAFSPLSAVLSCCGFHYNGTNASAFASVRFLLSMLYTIVFLLLFVLNVMLGEQEPEMTKSLVLKHGYHKIYLFEMLFLCAVIWNNFWYREKIDECMRVLASFDELCEVI